MSQSKLRFSIEESVWLKKGQEVAEVLSMSLDPDIQVAEEAGQVYIKGALVLSGKYCTEKAEHEDSTEENPLAEGVSYRSLTQLNVQDDGNTELVHRFPVDITIPSYRVEDTNEVKVEIESFEYELPNSTCFELSASICIYGIKDEKQRQDHNEASAQVEEVRGAADEEKVEVFTPFQFEARQSSGVPNPPFQAENNQVEEVAEVRSERKTPFELKPHFQSVDDHSLEATFDSLKSIAFSAADNRNEQSSEEENVTENDTGYTPELSADHTLDEETHVENIDQVDQVSHEPFNYQQQPQYYQPTENPYQQNQPNYAQPYMQNPYGNQGNPYPNYEQQQQQPFYYNLPPNQQAYGEQPYREEEPAYEQQYNEDAYDDYSENAEYSQEQEEYSQQQELYAEDDRSYEVEHQPSEQRDENALYLTKMLSGKEENFSRMRMYILQRGDSLEHICERYEITLNTLLRMNQLQQGEVSEGQIIYIPVSARY